jgi:hypothetical protein
VTPEFRPRRLMRELTASGVDYIVIGGIAAAAWGSTRQTNDLDVLCADSAENRERLAFCLTRLKARVTGSPNPARRIEPGLLDRMNMIRFETDHGPLDVLFNARGITYDQIVDLAVRAGLADAQILVTDIDSLIDMKTRAGRARDLEVVAELQALKELGASLSPSEGTESTEPSPGSV